MPVVAGVCVARTIRLPFRTSAIVAVSVSARPGNVVIGVSPTVMLVTIAAASIITKSAAAAVVIMSAATGIVVVSVTTRVIVVAVAARIVVVAVAARVVVVAVAGRVVVASVCVGVVVVSVTARVVVVPFVTTIVTMIAIASGVIVTVLARPREVRLAVVIGTSIVPTCDIVSIAVVRRPIRPTRTAWLIVVMVATTSRIVAVIGEAAFEPLRLARSRQLFYDCATQYGARRRCRWSIAVNTKHSAV
jgi:hypothetical protein